MSATGEREAGFTLLEMLVVLAVAGLVAGIGFPRLQSQVASQEWRTAVVAVTTLLRTARAQAVRGGSVATVSVAADGHALRTSTGTALALPDSVTVAMPQSLAFFSDGSASGGAVEVSGNRQSAQISVAPATGLPSVRAS